MNAAAFLIKRAFDPLGVPGEGQSPAGPGVLQQVLDNPVTSIAADLGGGYAGGKLWDAGKARLLPAAATEAGAAPAAAAASKVLPGAAAAASEIAPEAAAAAGKVPGALKLLGGASKALAIHPALALGGAAWTAMDAGRSRARTRELEEVGYEGPGFGSLAGTLANPWRAGSQIGGFAGDVARTGWDGPVLGQNAVNDPEGKLVGWDQRQKSLGELRQQLLAGKIDRDQFGKQYHQLTGTTQPVEPKPAEPKPAEPKPAEAKPDEKTTPQREEPYRSPSTPPRYGTHLDTSRLQRARGLNRG